MLRLKRSLQTVVGAFGGAFVGFFFCAFGGLIAGMQWGVSIGIFVGLIALFTGGGFSGFLDVFISSILITGLIGGVLSGLAGVVGGGFAGSTWGSEQNPALDNADGYKSDSADATKVVSFSTNSVIDEGLTEKILFAFDPRKPLGRRRFVVYNILYSFFYFIVIALMALLLNPEDPAVIISAPWFDFGVANILIIPHWLLCSRRAVAAKIPVYCVYGFMSWLLVFRPICQITIGDTLAKLIVVPSLILAFALLFKRNRLQLPYPTS